MSKPIKSTYKDCIEIKWTKRFKAGYLLQKEIIQDGKYNIRERIVSYNENGEYIGDSKCAKNLCDNFGIKPELASHTNNVCTIGFCEKNQKWYGWSHRSIVGFGIGDKLFDEDWVPEGASTERDACDFIKAVETMPFIERGAITITDLKQAKQSAINFAEYIG